MLDPAYVTVTNGAIVDPEDYNDTVSGYALAALEDDETGNFVHEKAEFLRELAAEDDNPRTAGEAIAAADLMVMLQHSWN